MNRFIISLACLAACTDDATAFSHSKIQHTTRCTVSALHEQSNKEGDATISTATATAPPSTSSDAWIKRDLEEQLSDFVPARTRTSTTATDASTSASFSAPKGDNERPDTNPSTKFGSPLSESVKDANKFAIGFLKNTVFDTLFAGEGRDFARFYALETIARVPYFSYLSVLHLYETLGTWRRAKYLKLHFAEAWNEMHHLLIMEELGGSEKFTDRFIAQHMALGYYGFVILLYVINPVEAYHFNENIEEHAFNTYATYLTENEEMLKSMPAPQAAIDYYVDGDMYMFDEFQTGCELRRPVINNLYDVFVAIRDDEAAHVSTMKALQTELDVSSMRDGECEVDIF